MKNLRTLISAAALATLCSAAPAFAQFPASVVGQWSMRANNTQPLGVSITSQGSTAGCPQILGTLGTSPDTIQGYYCPATGLVSFLRNSVNSGTTYQVFTGQLSAVSAGFSEQLSGTFLSFAGGNNNGAFSFEAVAQ